MVSGELPLIGHGLKFDPSNFNFINDCRQKYGKIFRIKTFLLDIIVISDRSLLEEYYKSEETKLSFIEPLIRSFIGPAISQKEEFIHTILTLVKTNLKIDFDDFIPKIKSEGLNMVQHIKNTPGKPVDVNDFVKKFIMSSSSKCFLSVELDEKSYGLLLGYVNLLGKVLVSSAFVPRAILEITAKPMLQYYKKDIIKSFKPVFDKYRNDPELNESAILRKSVDFIDPDTHAKLTDDQIGGVIISFLFASFGSTILGLGAMINDLMSNPEYWYRVRDETRPYIESNNFSHMLKDAKLLDACFWETCRVSSSFMPVSRYAMSPNESVGDYYVGQNILVGLCGPLLMSNEQNASDAFQDPQRYDPERFLPPRNEKMSSTNIITFGGGRHLCPGRNFAKMEILIAIAYLTNYFEPFKPAEISKTEIITAGAFIGRKTFTVFADKN